jgi:hypothetical protein
MPECRCRIDTVEYRLTFSWHSGIYLYQPRSHGFPPCLSCWAEKYSIYSTKFFYILFINYCTVLENIILVECYQELPVGFSKVQPAELRCPLLIELHCTFPSYGLRCIVVYWATLPPTELSSTLLSYVAQLAPSEQRCTLPSYAALTEPSYILLS